MIFAAVIFFAPEMGGYFLEHNNFIPANPMQTPEHIAPVWYFTPFLLDFTCKHSELLLDSAKLWEVIFMGFAVMIFFLLPWLDREPGKIDEI